MKLLFIILMFFATSCYSQTVIDMLSPADAQIILLEVKNPNDADIFVYKTVKNSEAREWNLKWKFKNGGWSNFAIYIAQDTTELHLTKKDTDDDEIDKYYLPSGKIYFVSTPDSVAYINDFKLDGVMQFVKKIKIDKKDVKPKSINIKIKNLNQ